MRNSSSAAPHNAVRIVECGVSDPGEAVVFRIPPMLAGGAS
jgi:hypothetical protein